MSWILESNDAMNEGIRHMGGSIYTPYWTIRYFTEVAPPTAQPFPEWVGFAH